MRVAVVKKDKKEPVIKALPHKEKPPMEKAVEKFVNHICRDDSFNLSGAISEIKAPLDMRRKLPDLLSRGYMLLFKQQLTMLSNTATYKSLRQPRTFLKALADNVSAWF